MTTLTIDNPTAPTAVATDSPRLSPETFTAWRKAASQIYLPRHVEEGEEMDLNAAALEYDTACLQALREIPCPECGSADIECQKVGVKRGTAGQFFRTPGGGFICPRIHKARKIAANQAFDIARGIPKAAWSSSYWGIMRVFN